jgi:threonylcarbamoyladenosine tRNA methylthiotransferase MtaB
MKKNPSVAFYTLGCKLNQAETEEIYRELIKSGYSIADLDKADICIINTCTVTHIADRKARHMVRLTRKQNPQALIIAAGCYAERAAGELAKSGADMVIGNNGKRSIPEILSKKLTLSDKAGGEKALTSRSSRVRSFIKIQDGCRHFCSYCIVPFVRRAESCVSVEEVINTVKDRVARGYKEVVLTGTEIGRYRDDKVDIAGLAAEILERTELERLHLSSLQPRDITEKLLALWSDARLSRHFHLALQSGSDTVLQRMNREYDTGKYREAVLKIRKQLPDTAITTDIMVGFPGESEQEFEDSYNFCKSIGFAAMHVFSYSARQGTEAAGMKGQVDDRIKKQRSRRMLALSHESADAYRLNYLGGIMNVLFETEVTLGSGLYTGLSENYIRVFAESEASINGSIVPVRFTRLYHHDVRGEIVK